MEDASSRTPQGFPSMGGDCRACAARVDAPASVPADLGAGVAACASRKGAASSAVEGEGVAACATCASREVSPGGSALADPAPASREALPESPLSGPEAEASRSALVLEAFPESPLADPAAEALAQSLAERALALFESREMYCAEAVLCALSEGLGGGLDRDQARGLAMGFGQGLGKAGCVCGALGGAVMGASFFLSRELAPGAVRGASRRLHAAFAGAHGSSCCRVLIRAVRHDPKEHFRQCAGFTRHGALLAAREVLGGMPRLASGAGLRAVARRPSLLASLLRRLADRLG